MPDLHCTPSSPAVRRQLLLQQLANLGDPRPGSLVAELIEVSGQVCRQRMQAERTDASPRAKEGGTKRRFPEIVPGSRFAEASAVATFSVGRAS